MKNQVVVPAPQLAALLFASVAADLPEDVLERLGCDLHRNYDFVHVRVYCEDLKMLLGACENRGVPLLPVTANGRIQSPEEKLDDGHIKLDYEGIFFTHAYESLNKKLKP